MRIFLAWLLPIILTISFEIALMFRDIGMQNGPISFGSMYDKVLSGYLFYVIIPTVLVMGVVGGLAVWMVSKFPDRQAVGYFTCMIVYSLISALALASIDTSGAGNLRLALFVMFSAVFGAVHFFITWLIRVRLIGA